MKTLGSRIKAIRKAKKLTQVNVAKAVGVSSVSVVQWEQDANKPGGNNLIALAKTLDCEPDWLLYGQGSSAPVAFDNNVETVHHKLQGAFPLISWVQAGDWSDISLISVHDAEHYPCPIKCSKSTFILKVVGKSMTPIFTEGELIFVDPEVQATDGKYIVARLEDEDQATFKQLIIEDGQQFLQAANPDWPTKIQPINGNCTIVGVVISAMRLF